MRSRQFLVLFFGFVLGAGSMAGESDQEAKIEQVVRDNSLATVEQVTNYSKAGGGCEGCLEEIREIIDRTRALAASEASGASNPACIPSASVARPSSRRRSAIASLPAFAS